MDRRAVWAIVLMMAIAMLPAVFLKKPPRRPPVRDTVQAAAPAPMPPATAGPQPSAAMAAPPESAIAAPIKTVVVTSPLYRYGLSTRGGTLVEARLLTYRSMFPGDTG